MPCVPSPAATAQSEIALSSCAAAAPRDTLKKTHLILLWTQGVSFGLLEWFCPPPHPNGFLSALPGSLLNSQPYRAGGWQFLIPRLTSLRTLFPDVQLALSMALFTWMSHGSLTFSVLNWICILLEPGPPPGLCSPTNCAHAPQI